MVTTLRFLFAAAYLTLLGLAVALAVLAAQHETLPGDVRIGSWAQEQPFPGETFSDIVRAVTRTEVVLGVGGAGAIALWLSGRRREGALLAAGLVVLPVLQWGLKELVDRPRPAAPLVELRAGFSSPSFPSGHVMSPTYLYGFFLWLSVRPGLARAVRLAMGLWAGFVLLFAGPPNVWLGVHWPSDVLGGWAWGLALVLPLVAALEALSARRA